MDANVFTCENGQAYLKGALIRRKKAKEFYEVTGFPELLIMRQCDIVASDDGKTTKPAPGKGQFNGTISNILLGLISGQYVDRHQAVPIKTHYLGASADDTAECLIRRVKQPIPLEVIVRNQAYGSFCQRYGVVEGTQFQRPTCEFTLKDDEHGDPLIPEDHIWALEIADKIETHHMRAVALAVNRILLEFFHELNIELADFKLVFGRLGDVRGDYSNLRIIGEISPDTCRLRDMKTGQSLDKDIFRQGLPGLSEAYQVVSQKILDYRQAQSQQKYGVGGYDENGNPLK